jgi:hypothetical protein
MQVCSSSRALWLAAAFAMAILGSGRRPLAASDLLAGRPSVLAEVDPSWQPSGDSHGQSSADLLTSTSGPFYSEPGYAEKSLSTYLSPYEESPHGLSAFLGYDAFRGHPDGSWMNNGIHTGLNYGTRLGRFSDWTSIGFQLGGSVGVYDWSGTDYRMRNTDQAEMQGFITGGFFRKPTEDSPWSIALVQDWMLNTTFSVMGENPTLGQWRGQIGYAFNEYHEYGLWGAWRGQGDTRQVGGFGPVTWRPVQQLNAYWRYKWHKSAADTWLWFGVPENDRLTGQGSLGDYLVGALANVPLSERVMLYSLVTYMHPSSRPGPAGSLEEAWNFTVGIAWTMGSAKPTSTVYGNRWMPQLPVANNGTFLVDASHTY